jgi:hypothetical protein
MNKYRVLFALLPLIVSGSVLLSGCATDVEGTASDGYLTGMQRELGEGDVHSFARVDAEGTPLAIGLSLSESALHAPPEGMTDGNRCFDHNADDVLDPHSECAPWHERALPLPMDVANRDDMPFKWVLLNWNNHGHIPPGVYDVPHFDVHFYMEPIETVFSWVRGPCGPEFIRCDQFEVATRPVPGEYMHPDYINVDAAAPAMGNHLVDPAAPEFQGEPFTRAWIYGSYDGRVIFYEEMVAQSWLQSKPDACFDIKTPPEVAVSGYYPNTTCSRFIPATGRTEITLEDFRYREAPETAS